MHDVITNSHLVHFSEMNGRAACTGFFRSGGRRGTDK